MIGKISTGLRLMRRQGGSAVAHRTARYLYRRYGSLQDFPVMPSDVASGRLPWSATTSTRQGAPLDVRWITCPPGVGSGGHTTMFRMVRALERAGHHCTIYLYDRYDGVLTDQRDVIRKAWPDVAAEVATLPGRLPDADALVATSWDTAHALHTRYGNGGTCFYFVQDFEPWFYGRGAEYSLAEATYSFGFLGITAGAWLAEVLHAEYGMSCDWFPFGSDVDVYRLDNPLPRQRVVFYAKPGTARRGHALGVMALERLVKLRPDADVHVFGERLGDLPFPATSHGVLTPTALNDLFNTCAVGLSLSFTNVSLLPWELLASGVVPVVNDARHNRRVLDRPGVRWAVPQPEALAQALLSSLDEPLQTPGQLSTAVAGATWDASAEHFVHCLESRLYDQPHR